MIIQDKVNYRIVMLRITNQRSLYKGLRPAVKKLMNNVIEATDLKGKYKDGELF